jgi:serine phosphatase RsbU (regulator of sigma subunit)
MKNSIGRDIPESIIKGRKLYQGEFSMDSNILKAAPNIRPVKPNENKLIYSGARLNLIYCQSGDTYELKGDRQSLGYKDANIDYEFSNKQLNLTAITACYLTTDGLVDQNGGNNELGFGSKRFKEIILHNQAKSLPEQKQIINEVMDEYMGPVNQRDDITVIGFNF